MSSSADGFSGLMDRVSVSLSDNLDWWVCSAAYRHPSLELYLNFAWLLLLKQLLEEGKPIEKVMVESLAVKKTIVDFLKRNGRTMSVVYSSSLRCYIRHLLGKVYLTARLIIWLTLYYVVARVFIVLHKRARYGYPVTLIDTFIVSGFDGKDRYYSGLFEHLTKAEKAHVFFVPTLNRCPLSRVYRNFQKLHSMDSNFLFKEEFLRFHDYCFVFRHVFRRLRLKIPKIDYFGFEVSSMIKEEVNSMRGIRQSFQALLNYRFFKSLRHKKIELTRAIDWFENQPIDKGWNMGVRRYYSEDSSFGYQGYIDFSNFYLNLLPTEQESWAKAIPKTLLVVGKGFVETVKKLTKNINVETAPAFRFQAIFKERNNFPEKNCFTILLATALDKEAIQFSLNLMSNSLQNLKINGLRVWVKPHPAMPLKELRSIGQESWHSQFRIVEGDFNELVEKSNVLMGDKSSSVCLETIAKGIPVIIPCNSNDLEYIPVLESVPRTIWRVCTTAEELQDALRYFYHNDGIQNDLFKEIAENIRNTYFIPLNRKAALDFVGLHSIDTDDGKNFNHIRDSN